MNKAVIYTRVSTGAQTEGTSLEAQELACLKKAAELQAQVVAIYSDPGVSGALYLGRPGIQKALTAIENGEANCLIIYKLDRSGRDVDVIRAVRNRVENMGARLVFADGMNFESNAVGKLAFNTLAGFAEFEKETIRERTVSGRRNRAEQGQQPSRTLSPYGYHVVNKQDVLRGDYPLEEVGRYKIVEEQAKWVREIFARYSEGASRRQIRKWLASQAVPSPDGKPEWNASTITRLIAHPAYKGTPVWGRTQRKVDEGRLAKGNIRTDYVVRRDADQWIYLACEPLVTEEVWQACQGLIETNKLRRGNPKHKYLLTGMMICPTCQRRMCGLTTRVTRYYRCPHDRGCPYWNINADKLENAYIAQLLAVAQRPELAKFILRSYDQKSTNNDNAEAVARLRQELDALEHQETATARAQVEAMLQGRNTIVYDRLLVEINSKRKEMQGRLTEMQKQAAQTIKPQTVQEMIEQTLEDVKQVLTSDRLGPGEKNALLRRITRAIHAERETGTFYIWLEPIIDHTTNGAQILIRVTVSLTLSSVEVDIVDAVSPLAISA